MLQRHGIKGVFCAVLSLFVGTVAFAAAVKSSVVKPTAVVKKAPAALTLAQTDAKISTQLRSLVSQVAVAPVQPAVLAEIERQIKINPALLPPTIVGFTIISEALMEGLFGRGEDYDRARWGDRLGGGEPAGRRDDPFAGQSYSSAMDSLSKTLADRQNRFGRGQTSGGSPAQQMLGDKMNKLWGALDAVRSLGGGTSFGAGGQSSGRMSDPRGKAYSGPRHASGHGSRTAESKRNNGVVGGSSQTYTRTIGKTTYESTTTTTSSADNSATVVHVFTTGSDPDGNVTSEQATTKTTKDDGTSTKEVRKTTYNPDGTVKTSEVGDGTVSGTTTCTGEKCKDEVTGGSKAGGGHCPQDNCEGDHPEETAQAVATMQALACALRGVCANDEMLDVNCDGRNNDGAGCGAGVGLRHSVDAEDLSTALGLADEGCDDRNDNCNRGGGGGGHGVAPACMISDQCGSGGVIDLAGDGRVARAGIEASFGSAVRQGLGLDVALEFEGTAVRTVHIIGNIRVVFDIPPGIADSD